jgi:hypothetical protein
MMKAFREERKTLREELKDEYKTLKEELKDEYRTLREGFSGLREDMEDVKTEFQYMRHQISPHTQPQMSMSMSQLITHEDNKECKFELDQQEVTEVITNTERAISCEKTVGSTYLSAEDFSDKTLRIYKVERTTSRSQEIKSRLDSINSQDLQKVKLHSKVIHEDSVRFLEDRQTIQRIEVRHFWKLKKRTHRNDESHKKLRTILSRTIQRVITTECKGKMCKRPVCDNTVKRMSQSKMGLVYITEIDNSIERKSLLPTKGKTLNRIKSIAMKNTQVISFIGSQNEEDFNYWKVRPPPKRKKEIEDNRTV